MVAELRIVVDGEDEERLRRVVAHLVARAQDRSGALKNIGEALLQTTHERFDEERDPSGKKWQPLAQLTRKLRGEAGPILNRSGRLKMSVNYEVSGSVLKIGPNTVDAAVHQFGLGLVPRDKKALRIPAGTRGVEGRSPDRENKKSAIFAKSVTIPARPYIGFGERDEAAAMDAIEDWFNVENLIS